MMDQDDDDEDEVVVLKNGELYNHLFNFCPDEFSTYEKSTQENSQVPQCDKNIYKPKVFKVSEELLLYTDSLLKSSILLDDDASYLYNFTANLVNTNKRYRRDIFNKLAILGFLYATPSYAGLLNSSLFLDIFLAVRNYFSKYRRIKQINEFISILKKIHFYIKKMVQVINEENAYLKLQEIKFKTDENSQEYLYEVQKKKKEVNLLTDILKTCIYDHIRLSRYITLKLRKLKPLLLVDNPDYYLAFSSDEQLGLVTTENVNCISSQSSGYSLEVIKNVYLLMQSELIRRLGLSFCPSLWVTNDCDFLYSLFELIGKYTKDYSNILETIFFYYQKHLFPEVICTTKTRNYELMDGYSILHKMNLSLSHIVSDARMLEDYIEKQNSNGVSVKFILSRIEELKNKMNDCFSCIQSVEKFFVKSSRAEGKTKELIDNKNNEDTDDLTNTCVSVGVTNLNIRSEDNVFFGITEGQIEEDNDSGGNLESSIQFPDYLMVELKETLVNKRIEFEKRETNAVQNNLEYQKFLEAGQPTHPLRKPREIDGRDDIPRDESQFQIQKLLASTAALKSRQFINNDEECFGSSEDED